MSSRSLKRAKEARSSIDGSVEVNVSEKVDGLAGFEVREELKESLLEI